MFEWKSGEDEEWVEEPTAVATKPAARISSKIGGGLALVGVGLALLAGLGLAYRQVNTQVTAVTNTREQEILAADRLLVETAVSGDRELFASLLRRSPAWAEAQIHLQTNGSFFDRPPLGLWLDTRADLFAATTLSTTQITISPDLTEAVLAVPMPYVTLDADGEMAPLLLQRTAVYRRQNEGWLLAEPDSDFWGEYGEEARPYLNLIAPGRDQDIAARLADDLNTWIERICQEIECPPQFKLQLRLATDPQTVSDLYSPVRFSYNYLGEQQTTRSSLPTPTLVGLPVDEAGYQILLRGYATHLALGLFNAYAAPGPTFQSSDPFVNAPDFDQMLADLALFVPWPTGYNPIQAVMPPPIPLPDQDILLLCQSSRAPTLFRYDTAADSWSDVLLAVEGAPGYYMTPFPDGQGVALVVGPSSLDGLYRIVWLHHGRERLLFTTPDPPYVQSVLELEPGRFLLYFITYGQNESDRAQRVIISAENCDDAGCTVEPFVEWAQPSPDGRHTLITRLDEEQGFVYALGNADGEEIAALENAYDPIWLDGRTLAFRQYTPTATNGLSDTSLMTAVFADDVSSVQIQPLLTLDLIRTAVPELASRRQLSIASITPYPATQPELLFLSIFDWQGNVVRSSHLVQYDWQAHEWTSVNSESLSTSWWTVNQYGRYLVIGDYIDTGFRLRLYDIVNQDWQSYETATPRFLPSGQQSWSDNGEWLVLPDTDGVRLIAPTHQYQKFLYHNLDYCEAALWVDRARPDETGP